MEENKTIQVTVRIKESALEKIKKKMKVQRDGTAIKRFVEQQALKTKVITFDDI